MQTLKKGKKYYISESNQLVLMIMLLHLALLLETQNRFYMKNKPEYHARDNLVDWLIAHFAKEGIIQAKTSSPVKEYA